MSAVRESWRKEWSRARCKAGRGAIPRDRMGMLAVRVYYARLAGDAMTRKNPHVPVMTYRDGTLRIRKDCFEGRQLIAHLTEPSRMSIGYRYPTDMKILEPTK